MDEQQFLQFLRDLSLEDGKQHLQEHHRDFTVDYATIGTWLEREALDKLYSPFASLKIAELLIFFGKLVQHPLSHALGLKAKGDALLQIGHYRAAIESLDAGGAEFLQLGDESNWARSRISWIVADALLGHVEEALQEAQRAREVFLRQNELFWVCTLDNNIALIYHHIGSYKEAIDLYQNMRAAYPTLIGPSADAISRSIARAEVNQAVSLAWLGNFEQAYVLQQQARDAFRVLGEITPMVLAEENLADLAYMQGYYGSALRSYYQAFDTLLYYAINDPFRLAELKLSIANCLVKLNRADEASRLAVEAVNIYRQSGISLDTGLASLTYATTLIASSKIEIALSVLKEAEDLFQRGGFEYYAVDTRLQQVELLLTMENATIAYTQAYLIKHSCEDRGLVAYAVRAGLVIVGALLYMSSSIHIDEEQCSLWLQEALLLCLQVTAKARKHNLQESAYKSYYLLGRIFLRLQNRVKAVKYYHSAIKQIERILADLAYDLSPSFLSSAWAVYEDMIALCLQQGQTESAFSYLEHARSLALWQYMNRSNKKGNAEELFDDTPLSPTSTRHLALIRMQGELKDWQERYRDFSLLLTNVDLSVSSSVDVEVLRSELKHSEEKIEELFERISLYQEGASTETHHTKGSMGTLKYRFDGEQLRQTLGPNQLLLAYFLYHGKIVIFALTSQGMLQHEILDGMEQLENLLPYLHARLQPAGWLRLPSQQEVVRTLLQKLYTLLIAPIESVLPSASGLLTIVPYGPLHSLPFHALHNGTRFLIEDFQIHYLPTANALTVTNASVSITNAENKKAPGEALVFGYAGKGHLERAVEEAKVLADMLQGNCYLNADATISRLIEKAPNSSIMHIATHGHSRLDAPNFSSVLLADGYLNAIDAFNLDLKGCELVTLSGCETGLSMSGGGDEQLGLGRAFLAAGAEALVMSLWPVEDSITSEFMQIFYRSLLQGKNKAQALREAQRELLSRPESIHTHPYFWAAFRLVGSIQPLNSFAKKRFQ